MKEHEATEITEQQGSEVKAVERVNPIHKAQLLSYMKLLDIPLGLIITFTSPELTDGIARLIPPGASLD